MSKLKNEVYVYRNLNRMKRDVRPVYSVMKNGRVIRHVHRILLQNARFVVRPGGRARVLREKRKNVHAFVIGTPVGRKGIFGIDKDGKDLPAKIRYNPYEAGIFMWDDKFPVTRARGVLINEHGISACYLD